MRINQLKLQVDGDSDEQELLQLWRALPPADQVNVAKAYARILVKAAKVTPRYLKQEKKG